jgi:hypothetical protein
VGSAPPTPAPKETDVSAAAAASSATRRRGINETTSQPNGEVPRLRQCSGMSPESRSRQRVERVSVSDRYVVRADLSNLDARPEGRSTPTCGLRR